MSASVTYGFITSSRRRAPSICSRIACEAATWPPGITCASAIGVEPSSARRGEVRGEVGAERAAVPAEARQEGRLRLTHDGAGDANHDVVEAAVLGSDPRSRLRPSRRRRRRSRTACGGRRGPPRPGASRCCWPSGKRPSRSSGKTSLTTIWAPASASPVNISRRLLVRPRAEAVHDHPHLDALGQLAPEERGHLHPDLALAPAEHEDVHGRLRRLHVREDPREEVRALDQRLDRRGGRPRERQRRIVRTGAVAGDERLGRRLRAGGRDRVGRRRPARPLRDPEHLPVDDDEERRQREPRDRRPAASPGAPSGSGSVVSHARP